MESTYRSSEGYAVSINPQFTPRATNPLRSILAGRRVLVITTPTVAKLYPELNRIFEDICKWHSVEVCAFSERSKTIDAALRLCQLAKDAQLGRRDVMLAIGGGVCNDLVRTAAALVRRGIKHVCIPTTLIGQIDAGVGIKAGVNFDGRKSYLGVFRAPEAVFVDPSFLRTLGIDHIRNGLAEVLKLAISLDRDLFEIVDSHGLSLLETGFQLPAHAASEILHRSIRLTLTQLDLDPREEGKLSRLLDFGHSLSPVIESATCFSVSHGEAVMIDICLCAAISVELEIMDVNDARRIIALARKLGLPTDHPCIDGRLIEDALSAAVKHRDGSLNLVLPTSIGSATFKNDAEVPVSLVQRALARMRREFVAGAESRCLVDASC